MLTFRRSLETPAREHPSAEEQVLEREQQREQQEREDREPPAHSPVPTGDLSDDASFNRAANTNNKSADAPVVSKAATPEPSPSGQALAAARTGTSGELLISSTDEEQAVLDCLSDVAIGLDEICARTSISASRFLRHSQFLSFPA